jgi:hypothetical protein
MIHVSIMYVNMVGWGLTAIGTVAIVSMMTEKACTLKTCLAVIAAMVGMMEAVLCSRACQKPQI